MFITSNVTLQSDINNHSGEQQSTFNSNTPAPDPNYQENRRREEMALHLRMKNRKKYTHLFELEKFFK